MHRKATSVTAIKKRDFDELMPHLQRAIQMRQRFIDLQIRTSIYITRQPRLFFSVKTLIIFSPR